jgi:predicted membrane GTPase involved in stress response
MSTKQIRNIAIIAHVDHGKTTMVDQLLRQSGTFADHEKVVDTVMDNNAIEKERGITILAKNCAVTWKARTSTSSTPPATRTSAVKSNARCRWSTAWCC